MSPVEIVISASSVMLATASLAFVSAVVKSSGRDHIVDKQRVKHLVATAPLERLDNVLAK